MKFLFSLCLALTWMFSPYTYAEAQKTTNDVGLPLYYWREPPFLNFGDYLSVVLVERIIGSPLRVQCNAAIPGKKLLAIGSILSYAHENDVIWGTGLHGAILDRGGYRFKNLDVRAVRGPITRSFLMDKFQIDCPEIYGDPALLMPYFFPELKKAEKPEKPYLIIPHYSDIRYFPKSKYPNCVYPTEPWDVVVSQILNSELVISSSLHGIIVAEAFGIPARQLRVSDHENGLKFKDYYLGTNRPDARYAKSVEEAILMGGERPFDCDLKKLYEAFPFDFWPYAPIRLDLCD